MVRGGRRRGDNGRRGAVGATTFHNLGFCLWFKDGLIQDSNK